MMAAITQTRVISREHPLLSSDDPVARGGVRHAPNRGIVTQRILELSYNYAVLRFASVLPAWCAQVVADHPAEGANERVA
jgi:hypothetical protein